MFRVIQSVGKLAGLQLPLSVEMLHPTDIKERILFQEGILFYVYSSNKIDQYAELEVVASREILQRSLMQIIGATPTNSQNGHPRPALSVDQVIDIGTFVHIHVAVVTPDYDHTRELQSYLSITVVIKAKRR